MEAANQTTTNEEVTTAEKPVVKEPAKKEVPNLVYFENAKVVCVCGNTFTTGSTKEEIRVEICSNCHPFFTGKEKFVDTEGRVERFQRLTSAKVGPKAKKEVERKDDRPKTLKEMLEALENR